MQQVPVPQCDKLLELVIEWQEETTAINKDSSSLLGGDLLIAFQNKLTLSRICSFIFWSHAIHLFCFIAMILISY